MRAQPIDVQEVLDRYLLPNLADVNYLTVFFINSSNENYLSVSSPRKVDIPIATTDMGSCAGRVCVSDIVHRILNMNELRQEFGEYLMLHSIDHVEPRIKDLPNQGFILRGCVISTCARVKKPIAERTSAPTLYLSFMAHDPKLPAWSELSELKRINFEQFTRMLCDNLKSN